MGMEKMGQEKTTKESNKKRKLQLRKKRRSVKMLHLAKLPLTEFFEEDPELAKELAEDRKIQERAQEYKDKKEKQARKRKKNILIAVLIIAVAAAGGTAYYMEQKKASEVSLTDITITDSQELVYAEVTKVVGNDISVSVVQESSAQRQECQERHLRMHPAQQDLRKGSRQKTAAAQRDQVERAECRPCRVAVLAMHPETVASMPSMQGGQGNMPGAGGSIGARKRNERNAVYAERCGKCSRKRSQHSGNVKKQEKRLIMRFRSGTTVITKLGTEATFSSLSSGDVIAIALEKGTDDIDRIWIVQ